MSNPTELPLRPTLSDVELADKASEIISELCRTGARSFRMRVPVDVNNDSDTVLAEVVRRFREGHAPPPQAGAEDAEAFDSALEEIRLADTQFEAEEALKRYARHIAAKAVEEADERGMRVALSMKDAAVKEAVADERKRLTRLVDAVKDLLAMVDESGHTNLPQTHYQLKEWLDQVNQVRTWLENASPTVGAKR